MESDKFWYLKTLELILNRFLNMARIMKEHLNNFINYKLSADRDIWYYLSLCIIKVGL